MPSAGLRSAPATSLWARGGQGFRTPGPLGSWRQKVESPDFRPAPPEGCRSSTFRASWARAWKGRPCVSWVLKGCRHCRLRASRLWMERLRAGLARGSSGTGKITRLGRRWVQGREVSVGIGQPILASPLSRLAFTPPRPLHHATPTLQVLPVGSWGLVSYLPGGSLGSRSRVCGAKKLVRAGPQGMRSFASSVCK